MKEAFGKLDIAHSRAMTMTFDTFNMASRASIHDHLRKMTEMINDLLEAGSALTDEQKIFSVLRSLPDSWDTVRTMLMHNTSIINLSDLFHHLKLYADTMAAEVTISGLSAQTKGNSTQKQKKQKFKKGQFKHKAQDRPNPMQIRNRKIIMMLSQPRKTYEL